MAFTNAVFDTVFGAFGTEMTYTASANILAGQVVAISSGYAVPGTADANGVGIALYDIPSGTDGAVRVCGCAKGVASGAITAGAPVYAGADGKVASTGTAVIGTALQDASADGDEIIIRLG